ncbi:TetR/AcrR family transcriptional regulator [Thalassospira australica]|uniref:TetR/AcrR family transcriptional regulator n=1 Tax=Thalassospira australica TaxID=1528106 RepID=UPI00138E13BF|nr:TetR/AcrR family transcriptional regulator [Thalassospira australica]
MTRAYNKTRRARKEQETHQRILDAAISLSCSVGPAATTISAVATKASVQRLTVYRHFPGETDIPVQAVTHWFDHNPLPHRNDWRKDVAAENWPIAILSMLYSYYGDTRMFWPAVLADRDKLPELNATLEVYDRQLRDMQEDILRHLPHDRRTSSLCQSVTHHAVQFSTWRTLSDKGLDTVEIAALMEEWIQKCPLG